MPLILPVFAAGTVLYAGFLFVSLLGMLFSGSKRHQGIQPISVIIAARNEEQNLPLLLDSLSRLIYPEYEVIIVNDHSTDSSRAILDEWDGKHKIRILHLDSEIKGLTGKKAAVDFGIRHSKHDLLAFTDADCELNPDWLHEINSAMGEACDYMLGFSLLRRKRGGSLFRLRNFERSIYYALAAAGLFWRKPITSMACNMAYRKSVFLKTGGFGDLGMLRSGDDDLLLMKLMPRIRKAVFNPSKSMRVISCDGVDAAVHHQTNIRRASKFCFYPLYLKLLAAFVFVYYAFFYFALFSAVFSSSGASILSYIALKTFAELILVSSLFFRVGYPILILFYPLQILLFPAQFIFYALRGSLGKYSWK
ncbi:MAG TPA: glycosyltransferase [Candidatus Cloacimonadota bacterium]|nr:glycosyltransferase [Candidatus Cloacimonadota bacterium]